MQRQNVMTKGRFRRVSTVSDAVVREQPDNLRSKPGYSQPG